MLTKFPAAVLFDLDGTLLDTHDLILWSMRHTMRLVLGKEMTEAQLMQKVGQPLETQMRDFSDDPAVQETLARVYREYNESIHDATVKAFEGVAEVLATLREQGVRVGVVTSKRHALALHGLELVGLDSYIEVLVGPDDCEGAKPDPAPVLFGCAELGLAPNDCWYVGDSPFDMAAGRDAGCKTAAALWGMFPRDVLAAEGPAVLCETPRQLLAALQGQ